MLDAFFVVHERSKFWLRATLVVTTLQILAARTEDVDKDVDTGGAGDGMDLYNADPSTRTLPNRARGARVPLPPSIR